MSYNTSRNGNYVYFAKTLSQIISVYPDIIECKYWTGKEYNKQTVCPSGINLIPISKDWLLHLGFQKQDDDKFLKNGIYIYFIDNNTSEIHLLTSDGNDVVFLKKVKYVSELQNDYFNIKSTELKLDIDLHNLQKFKVKL